MRSGVLGSELKICYDRYNTLQRTAQQFRLMQTLHKQKTSHITVPSSWNYAAVKCCVSAAKCVFIFTPMKSRKTKSNLQIHRDQICAPFWQQTGGKENETSKLSDLALERRNNSISLFVLLRWNGVVIFRDLWHKVMLWKQMMKSSLYLKTDKNKVLKHV